MAEKDEKQKYEKPELTELVKKPKHWPPLKYAALRAAIERERRKADEPPETDPSP